jgi:KaiC/GvpD/RAD55 family RecA-like ATPase
MVAADPIVSDLVIDVVKSAHEAIASHLLEFLSTLPETCDIGAVARALDHGYDTDLADFAAPQQKLGFNHEIVSAVFRTRLALHADPNAKGQARGDPIWESKEEIKIFSLFGTGAPSKIDFDPRQRKSRVSAIVQSAMRDARYLRHAEKVTTSLDPSPYVTIPSPLNIAAHILSDPQNISSIIYAKAALQEYVRGLLERDKQINLSHAAVSEALELINNRRHTHKPIRQDYPTVLFLCNLFAIHGYMAMRIDLAKLRDIAHQTDLVPSSAHLYDALLRDGVFGEHSAEFLINPHFTELPSIAEVMNLIDGLPIGLEGADIIFQGGIRLSPQKSIVAAVSGTFGAGKTLFSLSFAAALAPLGCKTLFLSFEESSEDIEARMGEVAPPGISRAARFYRGIANSPELASLHTPPKRAKLDLSQDQWFMARHLKLEAADSTANKVAVDPAAALAAMLSDTIREANFFSPLKPDSQASLPRFARPVIIIDGLHQLFDLPHGDRIIESSLRDLVDQCRQLGAIFIFSFSKEALQLKRLEYLCDLIIELDHDGFEDPGDAPRRYFQLLKARRQPARIGAHVFHLKGENGFRLKPSSDARLQESKRELWWDPDPRAEIFLTENAPPRFRDAGKKDAASAMAIRNWGQILVIGKGSSGKAGFGLYLLHRRWFDQQLFAGAAESSQLQLPGESFEYHADKSKWSTREKAFDNAGLPIPYASSFLETRVLVVSFLYQHSYYENLTSRLRHKRTGKPNRNDMTWGKIDELTGFDYTPLPDSIQTDTIELYPGMLGVEDFIAKVEKKLSEAEAMGLPYTGVLVDGLHNVFVQFPKLEELSSFWGMFYNILRRRRVTVVTTHTEFDVQGNLERDGAPGRSSQSPLIYNFEQAQRKIAPLLSALVSGADYLFELSPKQVGTKVTYSVIPRGSIGGDVGNFGYLWDKEKLILRGTSGPDSIRGKTESKATTSPEVMADGLISALAKEVAKLVPRP